MSVLRKVSAAGTAVLLAAGVASGMLAFTVLAPSPASGAVNGATPLSNLVNAGSPWTCLDANSNDFAKAGDPVQLWGCNSNPEQEWQESATQFNFRNSGGMCLDANSNDYANDGDNIQLWACNTHPEQEWTFTSAGQLQSAGTGMCLDANSNDYANDGDNIQLWACNTHPEQLWTVTGSGQLQSTGTGMCLDANSNDFTSEGDNIQLWACNTHPEQLWGESGQHFNFVNSSGMCLDANSNDYPNNGDNLQLWGCNTHPEQEWAFSGSGQLQNFSTNMCLDANSNNYPSFGDNLQLWACNTHPEQLWTPGTTQAGACTAFSGASQLAGSNGIAPAAFTNSHLVVPACGPLPGTGGGPSVDPYPGSLATPGYQCVEFSERYLYYEYHVTMGISTNGDQVVSHYAQKYPSLFAVIPNGTAGKAPVQGDVLSYSAASNFSSASGGHTSVVESSSVNAAGNGTITVVEENGAASGVKVLTVSAWLVKTSYRYVEWLHLK